MNPVIKLIFYYFFLFKETSRLQVAQFHIDHHVTSDGFSFSRRNYLMSVSFQKPTTCQTFQWFYFPEFTKASLYLNCYLPVQSTIDNTFPFFIFWLFNLFPALLCLFHRNRFFPNLANRADSETRDGGARPLVRADHGVGLVEDLIISKSFLLIY